MEDNARLRTQVAHFTREIQSTVAARATLILPPPNTTTPLALISDSVVAAAAVNRQSSTQHAARKTTPLPPCAPQVLFEEAAEVRIVFPKTRSSMSFTGFSLVEKKIFGTYTERLEGHVFTRNGADDIL